MKVLLASRSSRRRDLIKQVVDEVDFTVSGADEKLPKINLTPEESAMFLAEKKALKSLQDHKDDLGEDELIIGCDTVVTLDGELFGKPKDSQDAYNTLKKLSDKTHSVVTAVCLLNKNHKHDLFFDKTDVTFNELTDEMIWDYIETGDPFDKAGSYGIQNIPKSFLKSVNGDINNVIGLPTKALKEHLDRFVDSTEVGELIDSTPREDLLKNFIQQIKIPKEEKREEAKEYILTKAMPPWALGRLLDLGVELVQITGDIHPETARKTTFVMAGDHGVAEEGVSAFPQEVTVQMMDSILNGGAGINALSEKAGSSIILVDMGTKYPTYEYSKIGDDQKQVRIGSGTKNFRKGPAMSRSQALDAIISAFNIASKRIVTNNDNVIAIGELGIGNTSAASAILSVLDDKVTVEEATGRGTGVDDDRLAHKIQVIKDAIKVNQPNPEDSIDVLSKVGGFEIAGMVGVILAAALHQIPIVVDGFVATSAALLAAKLEPKTIPYMIPSHKSVEQGHARMWEIIGKEPYLDLNLRLGEGTGAVLMFSLIDAAGAILNNMTTFEEGKISNKEK